MLELWRSFIENTIFKTNENHVLNDENHILVINLAIGFTSLLVTPRYLSAVIVLPSLSFSLIVKVRGNIPSHRTLSYCIRHGPLNVCHLWGISSPSKGQGKFRMETNYNHQAVWGPIRKRLAGRFYLLWLSIELCARSFGIFWYLLATCQCFFLPNPDSIVVVYRQQWIIYGGAWKASFFVFALRAHFLELLMRSMEREGQGKTFENLKFRLLSRVFFSECSSSALRWDALAIFIFFYYKCTRHWWAFSSLFKEFFR